MAQTPVSKAPVTAHAEPKTPVYGVQIDLVDGLKVILPAVDEADAKAQANTIQVGQVILLPVTDADGVYTIIATWQIVTIRVIAD